MVLYLTQRVTLQCPKRFNELHYWIGALPWGKLYSRFLEKYWEPKFVSRHPTIGNEVGI
jgi:hypothetical protein